MSLGDYAIGNAAVGGPSSIEGVSPVFADRITNMVNAMPPEIAARFKIISGFRSPERQAQVNPGVTNSRHSHGMAVDLAADPVVLNWITQHPEHGVGFPLSYMPREQNHMEMLDASGRRVALGGAAPAYAASPDPQYKSGLPNLGVAAANMPDQGGQDYGGGQDPPVAPPQVSDRQRLLALAMNQGGMAGMLGGAPAADAFQPTAQPAQPDITQPSYVMPGQPLPLSRRL
jgi:hypothetical protein